MSNGGYPLVIVAGCCEWHKLLLTNEHRGTKLLFRTSPDTSPFAFSLLPSYSEYIPFVLFSSLTRQERGGGALSAPPPP